MAIDESLLETVRDGGGPILRTYGWNPPTLSVGYGQDLAGIDLARCRELGIGIVRRPTGGRAVLHWEELTYCYLSLPPDRDDSIQQTYLTIGRCLQRGLQLFGVDVELSRGKVGNGRTAAIHLHEVCPAVDMETLDECVAKGFAQELDAELDLTDLSNHESIRALELERSKYGTQEHLQRRQQAIPA
jgi:lipoate-protein ligase A